MGTSILNPLSSIEIFVHLYTNILISFLLWCYNKSGYPVVLVFSSCSFSFGLSFEGAQLSAPLEFPSVQRTLYEVMPSCSGQHPVTVRCKCKRTWLSASAGHSDGQHPLPASLQVGGGWGFGSLTSPCAHPFTDVDPHSAMCTSTSASGDPTFSKTSSDTCCSPGFSAKNGKQRLG